MKITDSRPLAQKMKVLNLFAGLGGNILNIDRSRFEIIYQGNIYLNGNHDPCQILKNAVHPKLGEIMFESLYQANTKQATLEAWL